MRPDLRRARAVCAAAAVLLALGCGAFAEAAAQASVSGRVTDGERGLSGVAVALMSSDARSRGRAVARARTDGEGRYRFDDLEPGRYQVLPQAPTHVTEERGSNWPPGSKLVNLLAGDRVDGVDFRLTRGGVVTGRVTGADGQPVVGEPVNVTRADRQPGEEGVSLSLAFNQRVATDDRGVYRAYGLEPGRYRVSVGQVGGAGAAPAAGPRRHYQRTFHPGTTDEAAARVIEVTAGGEVEDVDISLGRPTKTYSVRGRVVSAETGQPVSGVRLSAGSLDRRGRRVNDIGGMTESGARGEFLIEGLAPGSYAVGLFPLPTDSQSQDPTLYSDPVTFEVTGGNVTGLEVKLRRGATVSGVVAVEGLSDRAAVARLLGTVRVYGFTEPAGGVWMPGPQPSSAVEGGSFLLTGVRPGMLRLNVDARDAGLYFSRVEINGAPAGRDGIQVAEGAQVTGVRLVISYGSGVVRGQVALQDGGLPPNARVVVFARRSGGDEQFGRQAEADSRGRFQLEGLPAGPYEVVARAFANDGRRFESAPQQVMVADQTEQQITLALEPAEGPRPQGRP